MLTTLHTFLPVARKIQNKRSKLPILQHCCIDGGLIRMTDLETTILMPVADDRSYTIPVDVLYQVLKTKPASLDIDVNRDEASVTIQYDGHTVTCPTLDPEEYPRLDGGTARSLGKWKPTVFASLKELCTFASTDDLKPALNGVWFRQNGSLEACASDGCVLKYYPALDSSISGTPAAEYTGIIPPKAAKILDRFVDGPAHVTAAEDTLRVQLPEAVELHVRLIDERFPDFKPLLSFEDRSTLDVSRDDLLTAVQSAKPFANKHTRKGILSLQAGHLDVTTTDPEATTEFATTLPVESHEGDPLTNGFNLLYLERLLKPMQAEQLRIHYRSGISASLITDPRLNGDGPVSLVMPIRLEEDE